MGITINSRILLSVASIIAAAALIVGATFAFFSDSETSEGNVFAAGELDLKVDNTCYYNKVADGVPNCPVIEGEVITTWEQTDLGPAHKFFYFTDIKPGDFGEDTISLHVIDNDAWGRFTVDNVENLDNGCTEPELEAEENCIDNDNGELGQSITFDGWLDQGSIAGFQCNNPDANPEVGPCQEDLTEGNNIHEENEGPLFWDNETVDEVTEGPFNIADVLSAAYSFGVCSVEDGNTDYEVCHGLALDGRMVGSTTYYFGLSWNVPDDIGDEAQSDSLEADMIFEVEQWRNNEAPFTI